jgi:hypothetical protein
MNCFGLACIHRFHSRPPSWFLGWCLVGKMQCGAKKPRLWTAMKMLNMQNSFWIFHLFPPTNPIRGADTQLGDDGDFHLFDRAMGNVMPCEWRIWNDVVTNSGRKWGHIRDLSLSRSENRSTRTKQTLCMTSSDYAYVSPIAYSFPRTRCWIPLLTSGTDRPQSTRQRHAMMLCALSFIDTRRRNDLTASVLWRDVTSCNNAMHIVSRSIAFRIHLDVNDVTSGRCRAPRVSRWIGNAKLQFFISEKRERGQEQFSWSDSWNGIGYTQVIDQSASGCIFPLY